MKTTKFIIKRLYLLSFLMLFSCKEERLPIVDDFEKAKTIAKESNRSVLVLFDAWAVSNRKMIESVKELHNNNALNDYVIVHLMLDDKLKLSEYSITIGELNQKLQHEHFKINYFPALYITDSEGNILKGPLGYCKKQEIVDFIER